MKLLLALGLSVSLLAVTGLAAAVDLDQGSEDQAGPAQNQGAPDDDCYTFGGSSQSFSGTNRGRGNTYTVFGNETLTEFSCGLDFTGTANLYFYVLQSPTLSGTYTVLSETIVPTVGAGLALYNSGPLSVALSPGMYYGIGAAWGPETVGYVRDAATLPRNWDLGTVEDAMQISAPPPYTSLTYNHFNGAEYWQELCFLGTVPVDASTWGNIKSVYR
jgi:hypothetical protein